MFSVVNIEFAKILLHWTKNSVLFFKQSNIVHDSQIVYTDPKTNMP